MTRVPGGAAQRDGRGGIGGGCPELCHPRAGPFPPFGVFKGFCLPWLPGCPSLALTESQSSAERNLQNKRREKGDKTPEEKEEREGEGRMMRL